MAKSKSKSVPLKTAAELALEAKEDMKIVVHSFRKKHEGAIEKYRKNIVDSIEWGGSYLIDALISEYVLRALTPIFDIAEGKKPVPETLQIPFVEYLANEIKEKEKRLIRRDDYWPNSNCPVHNLGNLAKQKSTQEIRLILIQLHHYLSEYERLSALPPNEPARLESPPFEW